jgi:hypothetical protein
MSVAEKLKFPGEILSSNFTGEMEMKRKVGRPRLNKPTKQPTRQISQKTLDGIQEYNMQKKRKQENLKEQLQKARAADRTQQSTRDQLIVAKNEAKMQRLDTNYLNNTKVAKARVRRMTKSMSMLKIDDSDDDPTITAESSLMWYDDGSYHKSEYNASQWSDAHIDRYNAKRHPEFDVELAANDFVPGTETLLIQKDVDTALLNYEEWKNKDIRHMPRQWQRIIFAILLALMIIRTKT